MKTKSKPKARSKNPEGPLAVGMQETREVSRSRRPRRKTRKVFTPMETGSPDEEHVPGIRNPAGAQGGLGPLNQEGEGELQNDQLAALEQIEPEG